MVANAELAQYAIVEQHATDLGRVFTSLKRDNPAIQIVSHQWLYDCRDKSTRLNTDGYEITRQPLPPAKKGTRTPFTPEDDMKLVKFIARYSKPKGRLGHSLYEEVEKSLPNHTAQSWRQRYKTNQARLDYEIAKYEGVVRQRRDNHEDPYTDSDEEAIHFTATSGTGAWPSKSRIAHDKQRKPACTEQAGSAELRPLSPKVHKFGFQRTAIKAQPALQPPFQDDNSQNRPFRLDLDRPGERITFSDDDSSSEIGQPLFKKRKNEDLSQLTQETISESVQEELVKRDFPPLSRKRKQEQTLAKAVDKSLVGQPDSAVNARTVAQCAASPSVEGANVPRAEQARAISLAKGGRMTSRPLSSILIQDSWTGSHLNTLLSASQFEDLIYVCSGDSALAMEIADMLYRSQVEGWTEVSQKRAEELRRKMWTPEEDAKLAKMKITNKIQLRHGDLAVRARITYLQKRYETMDEAEKTRRRFPYSENAGN